MAKSKKKSRDWLVAIVEHEDLPMALRVRPKLDTKSNKAAYPRLARVSHRLAEVQENGLPDPEYNETLEELDVAIIEALESDGNGIIVLIETFAGYRNYYAYVSKTAAGALRSLKKGFPEYALTLKQQADPEWKLYGAYRERFAWD